MKKNIVYILALLISINPLILKAENLPEPNEIKIAQGIPQTKADSLLKAARTYFAFWNTGKEKYARQALADNFIDLNLPKGRLQGIEGPIQASAGFRRAVPDLSILVKSVYIVDNKVIGQLQFNGHFTGVFGDIQGTGQPISFSAVDMYTIKDGKIIENWHLEDNLTLMQQLGVIGN